MSSPRALSSLRRTTLAFRPKPTPSPRNHQISIRPSVPNPQSVHHDQHARSLSSTTSPCARLDHASSADDSFFLSENDDFTAAPEIDFEEAAQQKLYDRAEKFLRGLRIVPDSPSYFTGRPNVTDDYIHLQTLLRRYITLPLVRPNEIPRVVWRALDEYEGMASENVRSSRYKRMTDILKRMNRIHPDVMPEEVEETMDVWKRDIQPFNNRPNPVLIDNFGRAAAVGRRKASSAKAWVVEGDGEVLINGKPLHHAFGRLHDRQSVIWALKVTDRVDKYNVWATVHGGGTTGQAEALTLAVSKALMAHEPGLRSRLRKGESDCFKNPTDHELTIVIQPDVFKEIQGVSRERSPVNQRRGKVTHGSNVEQLCSYEWHCIRHSVFKKLIVLYPRTIDIQLRDDLPWTMPIRL